nr:hypothetical protein [uncultured Roseateles sp.]
MFVIYGWRKESQPIKQVLACYCYVCQGRSEWHLWRESEWVTLFGMKIIQFVAKDALVCARCEDVLPVPKNQSQQLLSGHGAAQAISSIEQYQLASKTEVQRNFLLSSRTTREFERET